MYRRLDFKVAASRALASIPAALQILVGVLASYSIARYALGHEAPFLAITVVISVLGFHRDARPRRVLESAVGILFGVVLAELFVLTIGRGLWQIAVVLFVAMLAARFASPSNAFALAAAVQAVLVIVLPEPEGGVFTRSVDGLIGGIMALLVTALVPRNPIAIARRDARRLVAALTESIDTIALALRDGDDAAASLALDRLRQTQALIDDWNTSLESAAAIARISPWLRRYRPLLRHEAQVLAAMDLSSRHLRVVGRRALGMLRDGEPRPQHAALLERIGVAITLLGTGIEEPGRTAEAKTLLDELAVTLHPSQLVPGAPVGDTIVVHLVRPLVVDLLVAAGRTPEEARALLPHI